jgi:hypothetical protein
MNVWMLMNKMRIFYNVVNNNENFNMKGANESDKYY